MLTIVSRSIEVQDRSLTCPFCPDGGHSAAANRRTKTPGRRTRGPRVLMAKLMPLLATDLALRAQLAG